MAKDFAKKSKKRKSASRFDNKKTKKSIPSWTWLVVGLIVGVLATFAINQKFFLSETKPIVEATKQPPSAKSRYQAVPADETTDSEFSFYDELENKTIEVPDEEPQVANKTTSTRRYIMQCGSFRKKASAETLRAQIAMNGFEANIKPTVEKSGNRWFRVVLGPYNSKRLAERERHQLERNNINNCRIW